MHIADARSNHIDVTGWPMDDDCLLCGQVLILAPWPGHGTGGTAFGCHLICLESEQSSPPEHDLTIPFDDLEDMASIDLLVELFDRHPYPYDI